ncbi:BTB/POZ domain-containing protein 9-like isoform X1 [Zophobas morio]|uniref:BTB/POZ domain-containing protein 9-like isoform X1 n=1 Tax=Zophobas morio TaxID=2755281 RepID=UPI003083BB6A
MANEEENSKRLETTSFASKLCKDISSLYLKKTFSDVCFIVEDQKLYAHRNILAVRSRYFENLLSGGLEEPKQEDITIKNVPLKAFKMLLRYIYTDEILVTTSNTELVSQVFALSCLYSMQDLQDVIISKLKPIDLDNVHRILNMAHLHDKAELKKVCYSFLEENPSEFLSGKFCDLTQESLVGLMQNDNFCAPEIDIFRAIAKWVTKNKNGDNSMFQYVRLGRLSIDEILGEVWPMDVFTEKELLDAIAEIRGIFPRKTTQRGVIVPDENVASCDRGGEVLCQPAEESGEIWHKIKADDNIVVKLPKPTVINHIHMKLQTTDDRHYSYYVETSLDEAKWEKIVDYRQYPCRSVQDLFFEDVATRYIRVVGTHGKETDNFRLSSLEAYYKAVIPSTINNLIRPISNIATEEHGAVVVQGGNREYLLNGDTTNYTPHTGFTYHHIRSLNCILIQLEFTAQPFVVSSMKLLLWDLDDRKYKYFIETSVNNVTWEIVADRRNENYKSWQNIRFDERPVVFIRIIGTDNTANTDFHCVHFECPSRDCNEMNAQVAS